MGDEIISLGLNKEAGEPKKSATTVKYPQDAAERFSSEWRERWARLLWLLFSFNGRINGGTYFWSVFLIYVPPILIYLFIISLPEFDLIRISNPGAKHSIDWEKDFVYTMGFIVAFLTYLWMSLAIAFKRLHDFGASFGTFLIIFLLGFIPCGGILGFIYLTAKASDLDPNKYGDGAGWDSRNR